MFPIEAVEHKAEITIDHDPESRGLLLYFKMDPTQTEEGDAPFYIPIEDVPAVISALKTAYEHITENKI
jgi:hypothetical protein